MRTYLTEKLALARRRRHLEAELAEYRTPAERAEIDMILSRHTAEQIQEIEGILRRQAVLPQYR